MIATPSGVGGPAAPGSNAKPLPGAAAPASNGTPAGNPSIPPSEAALVAEKAKAEHWRNKYDRDIGSLKEQIAELKGLAQGFQAREQPKEAPRTIADFDDSAIDEIVKKGVAEQNPGFVSEAMREIARRQADKAREEATRESRASYEQAMERQRVNARIASEFGAEAVLDENSDLRQRADAYLSNFMRKDKDAIVKNPELVYACFAAAARELEASDRTELQRLRQEAAERAAREEMELKAQHIQTTARDDVRELLAQGTKESKRLALRKRLPFLDAPPPRVL